MCLMPQLLDTSLFSIVDIDGAIGVGWKLNFYLKGTSTPKNTFPTSADASAGTNPNTNPIVVANDGRLPAIWLTDDADYKGVLTDENDVVKETIVQINGERLGASGGSAGVGFIQAGSGAVATTAQAKMRETVSVLDFGAVGGGVTDNNTAVTNAIATGFDVFVPKGYVFAVSGNITGFSAGQRIYGGGTFKKVGATAQPIFLLPDLSDGVWFDGITFDGNKTLYAASTANSGVMGYVTLSAAFTECTFQHFRDCGIKLRDGANLLADGNDFEDIETNGIEVRLYQNDPRTGLPYPTRPPLNGGYRITGNHFHKIDDGLHGAGEGCGISVASTVGTQFIDGLTVTGNTFEDVLRSVWSENNVAGGEGRNITVTGNTIVGNIAGAGTTETKDGIGMIGVKGGTITGNTVLNVGNFAPAGGNCACVQIAASDLITITGIITPTSTSARTSRLLTTRWAGHRMVWSAPRAVMRAWSSQATAAVQLPIRGRCRWPSPSSVRTLELRRPQASCPLLGRPSQNILAPA